MGSSYPGNIWKSFMSEIHKNLEPRDFLDVASVDEENIGEDTLSEQQAIVNKKKIEQGLPVTEYEDEEYEDEEYEEYEDETEDDWYDEEGDYDEYDEDYEEDLDEEWDEDWGN